MRCVFAAVLLLVSCSASAPPGLSDAPQPASVTNDAGPTSADAAIPDASPPSDAGPADAGSAGAGDVGVGAGLPDAGPTDAGSPGAGDAGADGGLPDAGSADDRFRLDCVPGGPLEAVWSITEDLDPWGRFGTDFGVSGDDGAGDFVINERAWSHSVTEATFTQTPAGRMRASVASTFEAVDFSVRGTWGYARNGLVVDMSDDWPAPQYGVAEIRDADGNLLVSWNAAAGCSGLPAGCALQDFASSATNGDVTIFAAKGSAPDGTRFAAVVALRTTGQILWQRAIVGPAYSALGVDDSGIAFIQQEGRNVEAVDRNGVTLYELAPSTSFVAGFGRVYRGDRFLLDVRDGTPALTLPFDPSGWAILTASRIVVADASGVVHSLDRATGQPIWSRTARWFVSAANDVVLLVGVDQLIHVVEPDGSDRVSCSVLPDPVAGMALVGSRLVVGAGGSVRAFDLP